MSDSVLDLLVAVLPFLLSLVGVWTFEPLSQHKGKWRVGLVVTGLVFSGMTLAQQGRQRAKTASDIRELNESIIRQDRESEARSADLASKFNAFVTESLRKPKSAPIVVPKSPTAEEIAAELEKRLAPRLQPPIGTVPTPERPSLGTKPTQQTPEPVRPVDPVIRPCREDRLSDCSDEQVLENLKSLVASIGVVKDEYSTETGKLKDIKGGKLDWARELTGIGGDKDSKWLKGFELANRNATKRFRDCCAQRVLVYHKELLQRDQKRSDDAGLYEWVQNLLKPINSKEWKKVRDEGFRVGRVYFDLDFFRIDLEYFVGVSQYKHRPS